MKSSVSGALVASALALHLGAATLGFERLSLDEGLSQSTVYCILEDHFGFLWVGGENGLNRYDGYGFDRFSHDPDDPASLASNQVRALLQDRNGSIWVGTVDAGISIFDYGEYRFTHHHHDPDDPRSLASNDIRSLAQGPEGDIWAATSAGVDRLAAGDSSWRHYPGPAASETGGALRAEDVYVVEVDATGTVWAGSESGLYRYSRTADRFVSLPELPDEDSPAVRDVVFDRQGRLWIAHVSAGLVRIDLATGERTTFRQSSTAPGKLASDHLDSVCVDHRGTVWIGTSDRGLDRLDPSSGVVDNFRFDDEDAATVGAGGVPALLLGRSEILWIGTGFAGLQKLDLKERPFEAVSARSGSVEVDRQIVFGILEDRDGLLWVAAQDALLRVDRSRGTLESFHPDPDRADRAVYALHQDSQGNIWVGTWAGGLIRLDAQGRRSAVYRHDPAEATSLAHDRVLAITAAGEGRLWIGTWGGGLDLFDPARGHFQHHRVADGIGLESDRVRSLRRDATGRLWVSTTGGGLSRLDPGASSFRTYRHDPGDPASLSHDHVAFVSEERNGEVWVATAGGLNRLQLASGRFEAFRERHGLPSDAVTAVLWGEDGLLWVAHFRGLSRFSPTTRRFENFDVSDGLACAEFNASACFASPTGELLFGGVGGVTAVLPQRVRRNPYAPRAVLTGFTVNGRPSDLGGAVAVADTISLRYDQNFLGFEFTGLELTCPARNRYAYKLEGFDRDWVEAETRRYVNYTNVPPGGYRLLVRAANNHGVWGDPAQLAIVIAPPFWKTLWFRLASVAAFALALAGVFGWRTRALRVRLAAQERLVAVRTRELADANAELRALAASDSLTGVANRRRFTEFIAAEWRRAVRFSRPLAVLMVDVDDFKAYNDSCGHQAGDECLRSIARSLAEFAGRPGDLLARYGGEEFVVALSETSCEQATAVAERMRRAVEELAIRHPGSRTGIVTVSLGVAGVEACEASGWEALVGLADRALYAAKSAGKNRVVAYSDPNPRR